MTTNNPDSGSGPGLPDGQNIPQHIVEAMMFDAITLHGLIQALEQLPAEGSPAPVAIITAAKPMARKPADDLSKQW